MSIRIKTWTPAELSRRFACYRCSGRVKAALLVVRDVWQYKPNPTT